MKLLVYRFDRIKTKTYYIKRKKNENKKKHNIIKITQETFVVYCPIKTDETLIQNYSNQKNLNNFK